MAYIYTWLGTTTFGVLTWAFHLESRVAQEQVHREALKELILSRLNDIDNRLGRIERSMNGHLRG